MLTKSEFLADLRHETRVIQHLATKVPAGGWDWRPTPAQRSTLELVRYLANCAIVPATAAVRGHWDNAKTLEAATAGVTPDTFAAAMDRQLAQIEDLLAPIGEDACRERRAKLPWGTEVSLGRALVDMALKPLVAYRMQLFLYAKQAGASGIGPANCWVGVDAPK